MCGGNTCPFPAKLVTHNGCVVALNGHLIMRNGPTIGCVRDDTLVSGRSFLRGYLKLLFSMHDHAGCELASDWLPMPSLAKKCEPFFHLQLTLGRGNT